MEEKDIKKYPLTLTQSVNIADYGFNIIQIETLSLCNMSCSFCAYPIRPDKGKSLSDAEVLRVLDSLVIDGSFKYACFSHFNEPLLDSRIFSFIRHAKKKGLRVMIITNAVLFKSEAIIKELINAEPDYIKVSLQTPNPVLFKEARGVSHSFEEYKNGIAAFLKEASHGSSEVIVDIACNFISLRGRIKRSLFGLEYGDPSVYNSVQDLKNDVNVFLNELKDHDAVFKFNVSDFDSYLESVKSNFLSEKYLNNPGFRIAGNISIKIKPFSYGKRLAEFYPVKNGIACGTKILGILANGNVVPCCWAYNDILSLGNIREDSLDNILRKSSEVIKGIRDAKDPPETCKRCQGAPTRRGAEFKWYKSRIFPHNRKAS
jgi:radical SAM protein with 4Fe4S-binding SPASM domain